MAINFPTSLDTLTNPTGSDTLATAPHSTLHSDERDAIEALEAKVGANSSAVTSSHDYKLSAVTGTDKAVTSSDSRLTDSRTPTGSAGGVLSGTYPNPGFAADMATQAELDAHTTATGTAVHGLGTISTQAANNVAITGGAIDGTTLGATTRSSVKATTYDGKVTDAGTTNKPVVSVFRHSTSGTPGVNFGSTTEWRAQSSTTDDQIQYTIETGWDTATHASRKASAKHYVSDAGADRRCLEMGADGSNPTIAFLGAAPVAKRGATSDLRQALIDFGLYTTGGATPLDLNGGTLTAATIAGGCIGSSVEAWSAKLDTLAALASVANLSALAGLSGAANKIGKFTGSGTMSLVDFITETVSAWTPVYVGSTTPGTHTYSNQYGWYFEIDQLVIYGGRCQINSKNSSGGAMAGNIGIGGLPFTVKNTTNQIGTFSCTGIDHIAFGAFLGGQAKPNTTVISLNKHTSGTASTAADVVAADVGANPNVIFSGFFQKA